MRAAVGIPRLPSGVAAAKGGPCGGATTPGDVEIETAAQRALSALLEEFNVVDWEPDVPEMLLGIACGEVAELFGRASRLAEARGHRRNSCAAFDVNASDVRLASALRGGSAASRRAVPAEAEAASSHRDARNDWPLPQVMSFGGFVLPEDARLLEPSRPALAGLLQDSWASVPAVAQSGGPTMAAECQKRQEAASAEAAAVLRAAGIGDRDCGDDVGELALAETHNIEEQDARTVSEDDAADMEDDEDSVVVLD
eukprot:CAMPEP_0117548388 /NCGR_PEP_ID=MMETSP0784-20121206/47624_1 /TAXON_ID=39447 /ORGANISM="" /LENGTH=254 /DNA_ID=CAMNT_0005345343 /DNA_START=34 /DNA_END=798 /DNA_ORIENTATION=+